VVIRYVARNTRDLWMPHDMGVGDIWKLLQQALVVG